MTVKAVPKAAPQFPISAEGGVLGHAECVRDGLLFFLDASRRLAPSTRYDFRVYVNQNSEPGEVREEEFVFSLGADAHFGLSLSVGQEGNVIHVKPSVTEYDARSPSRPRGAPPAPEPSSDPYGRCATNMTIGESTVGQWDPKLLNIVGTVACRALPLLVNLVAGIGLPLPTVSGFELVDPSVEMGEGFIAIATSFSLHL